MKTQRNKIGKEAAIAAFESGWWKGKSHREIALFQFFTAELCCPFDVFHEAMEKTLGRPVWTHEFGINDGLEKELLGEGQAPTMAEIINMIPTDKLALIVTDTE